MVQRKSYSSAFKEQAVRRVLEQSLPVADVAKEIRVHENTLTKWIRQYRDQFPVEEEPLTPSERAQFRELQKENRELRMKNEFLGKAAAFVCHERADGLAV